MEIACEEKREEDNEKGNIWISKKYLCDKELGITIILAYRRRSALSLRISLSESLKSLIFSESHDIEPCRKFVKMRHDSIDR